jgi:hypothetical protein
LSFDDGRRAGTGGDLEHQRIIVGDLYIDGGYIASVVVEHLLANGSEVICRP